MSDSTPTLTNEQRAEHLDFLNRVVKNALRSVMQLIPVLNHAAADFEIQGLERAIIAREEFRLWGQADPPFAQEDITLLEQSSIPSDWLDARPGMRERWASIAFRIAALLPPEE